MKKYQLTDTAVMVSPDQFGFNPETAATNIFQHIPAAAESRVREAAQKEFASAVEKLRNEGINIILLKSRTGVVTPDALFPNNWFSSHPGGQIIIYPMLTTNRRLERQTEALASAIKNHVDGVIKFTDLSADEKNGMYLEGTGSMVLDRTGKIAYAMESARTIKDEFYKWCRITGYRPVLFKAYNRPDMPIYHTNMGMSIGEKFAVICLDAIKDDTDRRTVVDSLESSGKTVIPIAVDQIYKYCGNMLQMVTKKGERVIIMSDTAFKNFDTIQKKALESNGRIVTLSLPTIEDVGGGSARCLLAEIFR